MLRSILAALAALVLVTVCLIPDDSYARGGGGYRGGGGGAWSGGSGGYRGGGGSWHGGGGSWHGGYGGWRGGYYGGYYPRYWYGGGVGVYFSPPPQIMRRSPDRRK